MVTVTLQYDSLDSMLADLLKLRAQPLVIGDSVRNLTQAANDDRMELPLPEPTPAPIVSNDIDPPPQKRRGRKPKEQTPAQPEVAQNTGSSGPEPSGETSQDDAAVSTAAEAPPSAGDVKPATLDEVNAAARKLISAKGLPKCLEVLRTFGDDAQPCTRISQLKPEFYGAFMAAAEKAAA